MYILADITKIVENWDLVRNKDDFKYKKSYNLMQKILYFYKYIFEMYFLADINKIVENEDGFWKI